MLKAVVFFCLTLVVLLPFSSEIYSFLARPLARIGEHHGLVAVKVLTPFSVPLRLVCLLSFVLSLPYLIYQIWSFVAPALYPREKRWVWPVVFTSLLLFCLGVLFAYYLMLPPFFSFLRAVTPQGVTMMTDIEYYWSFVLNFFLACGLAFQIPIVLICCCRLGWVSLVDLKRYRKHYVVFSFVLSAVMTPPDILSQLILASLLCLLYEFGLIICRHRKVIE